MVVQEGIWVFLDNSNLWIETKKIFGRRLNNELYKEDPRVRIDLEKLERVLRENVEKSRIVEEAILYGSGPEATAVWEQAQKKGWMVEIFKKRGGKEKKVDAAIAVDITETVAYSHLRKLNQGIKYEDGQNIIVLVSGDGDMVPVVEKVIEQKGIWKIEIVGLEETMSTDLKDLAAKNPSIAQTTFLNPDSYSFIQMTHSRRSAYPGGFPLTDKSPFDFGEKDTDSYGILLEDVTVEAIDWLQAEIPSWPFQYQKQISPRENDTMKCKVSFSITELNECTRVFNYLSKTILQ